VTFVAHDRDLAALGDTLTATDPDGNTVVFTRSREADAEAAREWAEGFEMG